MVKIKVIYLCVFSFLITNVFSTNLLTKQDNIELKMNNLIDLNNIDINLLEKSVIHLSNQYRIKKGKNELSYNKELNYAAYIHSSQMVKYDFFNHTNKYEKEFKNLTDRINYVQYSNYQTLSENIMYGYIDLNNIGTYKDLANVIVNSFIESAEHKKNLLAANVDEIGCGIAFENKLKDGYWYFYFTQDFGKRF